MAGVGSSPVGKALGLSLGAATACWLAAWLAFPAHGTWRIATEDVLWSVICGLAGASAFYAASRPANRDFRRAFVLLGTGSIAWGLGQAAWTWSELIQGDTPSSPSLADIGFAGSLPLLAAGLLSWPRSGRSWTRSELLDTLLLLGVAFLFGFAFVLAPVVEAGLDGFSAWLLLAYPLGDILILGVILTGVALKSLRDHGRLIVLGLGLLALVAADTLFALAGDAYATGHPLDVGWALGFAALGACTLLPPGWGTRLRVPARIGPFLVIALFALVGAYDLVQWSGPLPALELADAAIAFALLLLLALRYASLAGARLRESRRLEAISFELESAYAVRQGALDASRTGVCVIGPHQAVAFQNSAWRRLLGSAADDPEGWADLLAGEVPSLRYWTGGKFLVVSRVSLAGGDTVITVDDLTDQERERSTRDRFLAEVVGAREREARRIAELLHDDVVQRLTALAMRLELAGLRASDPSLGELSGEAGGIVGSIRQLLVELHPAVLESQGLSAAADAAAHTLRSLGVVVVVHPFDPRLPVEVEQLAYRLVQEAFANVFKHAHAARVDVSFSTAGRTLRCQVSDDGRGFDPDFATTAVQRGSLGLHLVRERIELAGGRFLLESAPGAGTTFVFELPVDGDTATSGSRAEEVAS